MEEEEKREEVREGGEQARGPVSVLFFVTSGRRKGITANGRESQPRVFEQYLEMYSSTHH